MLGILAIIIMVGLGFLIGYATGYRAGVEATETAQRILRDKQGRFQRKG